MREKLSLRMRFAIIFLIGALHSMWFFSRVSYYDSDGIYNSRVSDTRTVQTGLHGSQFLSRRKTASQVQGKGRLENYFKNLSDEYASISLNDVFVDVMDTAVTNLFSAMGRTTLIKQKFI